MCKASHPGPKKGSRAAQLNRSQAWSIGKRLLDRVFSLFFELLVFLRYAVRVLLLV
jgi:hypothetical protein